MIAIEKTYPIKSIELPNRVKLQYVEQGDPAGVPVILLHGITDSWRSFELPLVYMPPSIRAFAISQRGHGDSDRPRSGYDPRDFAADVAAFIDVLKLQRAVIVGHSMGSVVAQRFALDYADRVLGVALVGSFVGMRDNPSVLEFWNAVTELSDPIDPDFALEFQQSTLAQPIPPAYLDAVVRESLKVPARVWRSALEGLMGVDYSGELSKVEAPTLVIWGDQDSFCPRGDQDALAAAIKDSRLMVYHGAGHAVHWEEPERFASDLAAFAEGLINSH
ncbi:MAG TPA: alpha/beta hydrolase [Blastocatellia bacterium]|nr:alpha/beta hydrolase [Blastocatellia bacterium]